MTLGELIIDKVQFGFEIKFSGLPMNLHISIAKVSKNNNNYFKVVALPYSDHCDEQTIVRYITMITDDIDNKIKHNTNAEFKS